MEFTRYGTLAALALAVTLIVTGLEGRRRGLRYTTFISFAVLAIPLTLICSRLVYCLASLSYYTETIGNASLMLHLRDGGYSMLGALLGLIAAALLVSAISLKGKRDHLPNLPQYERETTTKRWWMRHTLLDSLALGMPLGLLISRLAEPLCSMGLTEIGWGYPYTSPLFAFLESHCDGLHPVFAYEAVAAAVIFAVLLIIRRHARQGDVFLSFLLLFGCSQTVLESMISTKHMMFLFVHITQVATLLMALLPLILWSIRYPRPDRSAKLRLLAAWALAVASIVSALVQEINVTGADRTEAIAPYVPLLLAAGAAFWCVMWRKAGLVRLLSVIIASSLAIAAILIDQTDLIGEHYRLALWGIMACDILLLCLTGFALRRAADNNEQ